MFEMIAALVLEISFKYELDHNLVAAIIYQESAGHPYATRFEQKIYDKLASIPYDDWDGYTPVPWSVPTPESEHYARSVSYGVMQILGNTARFMGYKNPYLATLYDPRVNIEWGCKYLRLQFDKGKAKGLQGEKLLRFALKRYNGSSKYADIIIDHIKKRRHLVFTQRGAA